jgi:dTDP-4-amino-4,6-dideoxygalactose transaminase
MTFLPFARPVIDEAMIAEVGDTLRSLWIASGPQVQAFEKSLSEYHGGRPVRVLTSATAAMEVAFQVCGIGPGDEVITSAMTFFSVGNMIRKAGAKAVFVDCDLMTRNIDLAQVEEAITHKTRAVVPTHFSGLPCDMDRLYDLADAYGVRVVEDAALAIGSSWQGRKIGAFGDIATFSFHPNKNMTTIEGGAIVFADEAEAKRAEVLRFHGITKLADGTRDVDYPGGKFNLSDVSARLGLAQLRRLDEWCAKRRELAGHYFATLGTDPACALPAKAWPGEPEGHSWNMFCVLLPLGRMTITRKQFIETMETRGIGIGVSYEAMHLTTLFRNEGHKEGEFPNAERIARETVSLPLHPAMTKADVERVCREVAGVLGENSKSAG